MGEAIAVRQIVLSAWAVIRYLLVAPANVGPRTMD
jgi:hypothetical protein